MQSRRAERPRSVSVRRSMHRSPRREACASPVTVRPTSGEPTSQQRFAIRRDIRIAVSAGALAQTP